MLSQRSRFQGHPLLVLWLLLLAWFTKTPNTTAQPACPVKYERHQPADIAAGSVLPYLLGGIYTNTGRPCINCRRGGLWADFCSFNGQTGSLHYDQQICARSIRQQVLNKTLGQMNGQKLLTMTPCDLWERLRGRTTWVIGDSMAKDLFRAIRCFLIEFQNLKTFHVTNNYTVMSLLGNIPGDGQPWCAHMLENTRLCQVHSIQGQLFVDGWQHGNKSGPGVFPIIIDNLASQDDIFLLHFGLWHAAGVRQAQYLQHLHSLGRYYSNVRHNFSNIFFMETPKQHFDSADGDYVQEWTGQRKGPFTCQPVQGVSLAPTGAATAAPGNAIAEYVANGTWRNIAARTILQQEYGMPLLSIYNSTATAWQWHRNNSAGPECSHYCFPSAPQLWLWALKGALEQHGVQPVTNWKQRIKKQRWGCATVLDRDEGKLGEPLPKQKNKQQLGQKKKNKKQTNGLWQSVSFRNAGPSPQEQQQQQQQDQSASAAQGQVEYLKKALQKLQGQNKYLMQLLQQHRQQTRQQQQQQLHVRLRQQQQQQQRKHQRPKRARAGDAV